MAKEQKRAQAVEASYRRVKAPSTVVAIPQLLEQILVDLDTTDIIRLRRVNRSFKDTIDDNPAMQQKTFIRKDDADLRTRLH